MLLLRTFIVITCSSLALLANQMIRAWPLPSILGFGFPRRHGLLRIPLVSAAANQRPFGLVARSLDCRRPTHKALVHRLTRRNLQTQRSLYEPSIFFGAI